MKHVANQNLIHVYLLFNRRCSHMEPRHYALVDISYFRKRISQNRPLDHRLFIIQIQIVNFENLLLVFMNIIFVYRFCSDVNIMGISDKRLANQFDIRRHLISLLKARIEGIEHNNDVHFGSIGEVRPVEAISHVIFVDGTLDVRIVMVFKM